MSTPAVGTAAGCCAGDLPGRPVDDLLREAVVDHHVLDLVGAPAVGRDAAQGGLGLYLVAQICGTHGWTVDGDRKHVWARIDHTHGEGRQAGSEPVPRPRGESSRRTPARGPSTHGPGDPVGNDRRYGAMACRSHGGGRTSQATSWIGAPRRRTAVEARTVPPQRSRCGGGDGRSAQLEERLRLNAEPGRRDESPDAVRTWAAEASLAPAPVRPARRKEGQRVLSRRGRPALRAGAAPPAGQDAGRGRHDRRGPRPAGRELELDAREVSPAAVAGRRP
jgi:hypothetical protein